MSGTFRPVEVPDLGATLARVAQIDAMRQQTAIAQQTADQDRAFSAALPTLAPALASGQGPEYSRAIGTLMGMGQRGLALGLPLAQQDRRRREAQDFIRQAEGGGAPAMAPMATPAAMPAGGGDYITRLVGMESGGDPTARNPRSSATGATQFIDSTWLQFAQANPQRFQGMNREQILAARNDPNLSREAAEWYRRENMGALQAAGLPANDGTAALAHRFGPAGATALLRADPNAPIAGVVGEQVMRANPDLSGRTVAQVVGQYQQRFGGGNAIPASAGAPAAAPQASSVNPNEMRMIERALASDNEDIQRWGQARLRMVQLRQQAERRETAMPAPVRLGDGPHGPAGVYRPRPDGTFERLGDVPPPNQTTVIQGDTVRGRADAATLTEVQKSANDARQIIALFDRAEQAVRRVPEGQGAQLLPIVGQAARALGIEVAGTAEAEVLRSLTNGMAVLQRAPGSGATTDFEMRLFMQAVPRLGNTRDGNLRLIDIGRRLARRRQEEAAIWRRHAGEPDLMDRLNALPPVFTEEDQQFLQDATPVSDPGGGIPGPGGQGVATPPVRAPAPPRPGEVRDGFRFRGGNPADRNSWEPVGGAMPQGVP